MLRLGIQCEEEGIQCEEEGPGLLPPEAQLENAADAAALEAVAAAAAATTEADLMFPDPRLPPEALAAAAAF